ncbi:MAG: class I SAM-dependent RNA methyltransferase [Rhodospirillales bacterium]
MTKARQSKRSGRRPRGDKRPAAGRVRLRVERLGHRGDGVAAPEAGGDPVYVPYTLPGEVVDAEVSGARGRLLSVIEPSSDRIAPDCPVFGSCGGCATQHMAPDAYAEWKRDIVVTALRNQRIETEIGPLIDAHGAGRRRVTVHTARAGDGSVVAGFHARRGRSVVDIAACPVLTGALAPAFDIGRAIAACAGGPRAALDLRITATDSGLDVDVAGADDIDLGIREGLAAVAAEFDLARLTFAGETLAERRRPVLDTGGAPLSPPPRGFLQATHAGEAALAGLVLDHVPGGCAVADLFCGVGPFALRLARRQSVLAVDSDGEALGALEHAVNATPGLKPVDVRRRDLFEDPLNADDLGDIGCVVFDPPRAGAEAQARELAAATVPVVVNVSCDPATFARDAAILIGGGYRLEHVTPVDQFRHAAHIEIVGVFTRRGS